MTALLQLPNGDWIDPAAVRSIRQLKPSFLFGTAVAEEPSLYGPRVVLDLEVAEKQYVNICLPCSSEADAVALRDVLAEQCNTSRQIP